MPLFRSLAPLGGPYYKHSASNGTYCSPHMQSLRLLERIKMRPEATTFAQNWGGFGRQSCETARRLSTYGRGDGRGEAAQS